MNINDNFFCSCGSCTIYKDKIIKRLNEQLKLEQEWRTAIIDKMLEEPIENEK